MASSNHRPRGITLLAIWFFLNAVGNLVFSAYNILSGINLVLERALVLPKYFLVIQDVLSLFFNSWIVFLCFGLWQMRRWAWRGTLITQYIKIFVLISVSILLGLRGEFTMSYVLRLVGSLIFIAVIFYYFLRPKIKTAFHIN